jgi:hypothetical protein
LDEINYINFIFSIGVERFYNYKYVVEKQRLQLRSIHANNVTTLALGLRPRQGLARLWAKKKPRNEGKCEGMNRHTPKRASTLGVWNPSGFLNL